MKYFLLYRKNILKILFKSVLVTRTALKLAAGRGRR